MKVVVLGTAHGSNVPGKQSPDGEFREYAYSRKIIKQVKSRLEALGFIVFIDIPQDIVPTPQKIELQNRVSIVNKICAEYGTNNCLYVSIHVNAAGSDGKWKMPEVGVHLRPKEKQNPILLPNVCMRKLKLN